MGSAGSAFLSGKNCAGQRKIIAGGDFQIERGAGGEKDWQAGAFIDLCVISQIRGTLCEHERLVSGEELSEVEALGGLGLEKTGAVDGLRDGSIGCAAFERGRFGEGRQ